MRRKIRPGPRIIERKIVNENGQLLCIRNVDFRQLPDDTKTEVNDAIRVYGGHCCAVLQLRGISPITDHGKPRRMIATASYLDRNECDALIQKLTEIRATLSPA